MRFVFDGVSYGMDTRSMMLEITQLETISLLTSIWPVFLN